MDLKLTPNAIKVLERRYLRKDQEGRLIETPEEMFTPYLVNFLLTTVSRFVIVLG